VEEVRGRLERTLLIVCLFVLVKVTVSEWGTKEVD